MCVRWFQLHILALKSSWFGFARGVCYQLQLVFNASAYAVYAQMLTEDNCNNFHCRNEQSQFREIWCHIWYGIFEMEHAPKLEIQIWLWFQFFKNKWENVQTLFYLNKNVDFFLINIFTRKTNVCSVHWKYSKFCFKYEMSMWIHAQIEFYSFKKRQFIFYRKKWTNRERNIVRKGIFHLESHSLFAICNLSLNILRK